MRGELQILDKKWVMYSSDLLRAKQTANIVAKHLKIEPVLLKVLRERNLGSAVGKSVEWLSIFNAIWLGLEPEMLNQCDLFGMAGGVSFLNQGQDKKHRIRKLSDMSYIK